MIVIKKTKHHEIGYLARSNRHVLAVLLISKALSLMQGVEERERSPGHEY